ncbi:MAG: IPT/TIG domain-containing protein [Candidatus Obscuribacterales bacterium]
MKLKKSPQIASVLLTLLASVPEAHAEPEWITLAEQKPPLVAESNKAINASEVISLQKGQDQLQLYLTYMNGTASAPGFEWLRISSASMNYVTEKQFLGKKDLTLNVTGDLTWSGNQLLITGAGPKGATFGWIIRTPKPTVTAVSPSLVYSGDTLTITGTNFSRSIPADIVTVAGQPAQVISATPTQIVVKVPEDQKGGKLPISLNVAGIDVAIPADINVNVNAQPYLQSLSANFVAPGENVTIYGEGFSPNANDNEVYIGPFRCNVVQATPTSLTVTAAGGLSDGWYATNLVGGAFFQVKVLVNGVRSRNQLTIQSHNV